MRKILYATAAVLISASGGLPAFAQAPPAPADAAAPADAPPAAPAHHHHHHHHHRSHHAMASMKTAPDPQKEAQDHLTTPTPK